MLIIATTLKPPPAKTTGELTGDYKIIRELKIDKDILRSLQLLIEQKIDKDIIKNLPLLKEIKINKDLIKDLLIEKTILINGITSDYKLTLELRVE